MDHIACCPARGVGVVRPIWAMRYISNNRFLNLFEKYSIRPYVLLLGSDIAVFALSLIVGNHSSILHIHPAEIEEMLIGICVKLCIYVFVTKLNISKQKPVLENHPVRFSSPVEDLGVSLGFCWVRSAVDATAKLEPLPFLEIKAGRCNDLRSVPPCSMVGDRPLIGNALVPILQLDTAQPS